MATRTRHQHHRPQHHRPEGRTLHLVDVENLAGGTGEGTDAVAPALDAYRRTVALHVDDHVVVASGPTFALAVSQAWPGVAVRVGKGVDGADRVLLHHVDPAFVAARYDRVVIGSGDHCFAGLVTALRNRGVAVVVVARPDALASALRQATYCRPLASPAPLTAA